MKTNQKHKTVTNFFQINIVLSFFNKLIFSKERTYEQLKKIFLQASMAKQFQYLYQTTQS